MTVEELVKELMQFPFSMEVSVSVVGDDVEPVEVNEDGTVVIDSFQRHGNINVIESKVYESRICKLEVEI